MSYNSAIANSKFMQIGQKLWVLLAKSQLSNYFSPKTYFFIILIWIHSFEVRFNYNQNYLFIHKTLWNCTLGGLKHYKWLYILRKIAYFTTSVHHQFSCPYIIQKSYCLFVCTEANFDPICLSNTAFETSDHFLKPYTIGIFRKILFSQEFEEVAVSGVRSFKMSVRTSSALRQYYAKTTWDIGFIYIFFFFFMVWHAIWISQSLLWTFW